MAIRPPTAKELRELEGLESTTSLDKEARTTKVDSGLPPTSASIYEGDALDDGGPLNGQWQTLDVPSPAFLAVLYRPAFRDGKKHLYEWQKEELEMLRASNYTATLHKPYKLALCACNGSGKDYIITATTIVWMALVNIRFLSIITSSSGAQLTAQTENYIRSLCEAVNDYHKQPIFRIRQRFIKCNLSGSEIRLFATDEAGKAEGYHPLEPDARMAIVVNEAKNVSEEIFGALRRCTGYTHWLNISTPGQPSGSFYRSCTKPELGYRFRRVQGSECPDHLSDEERQADAIEFGVNSALYRSKHLALFTSLDSDSLVPLEVLEQCLDNKVPLSHEHWPLRIGGDIAAGGDENALVASKGNVVIKEVAMREKDTTLTADWFERQFISLGIERKHQYIFMDDGGIGHAVIDMLRMRGWDIKRIRNEARSTQPKNYGNLGAQNWFQFARLCEEKLVDLTNISPKLKEQIPSRQYKKSNTGGRIFLESKKEAKAHGRNSPDRADALVLSFTGLSVEDFLNDNTDKAAIRTNRSVKLAGREELDQYVDNMTFGELEETAAYRNNGRIHNSLAAAADFKGKSDNENKYPFN